VYKSHIISVIKEFELTIEIEDYFDAVGIDEEEITFDEFCRLFEPPAENSVFYTTYKSFKSILTTTNFNKKNDFAQEAGDGFNPTYQDYLKFC